MGAVKLSAAEARAMPSEGLFDAGAVLAPLLASSPGSSFVSTCGICGQRIDGPSDLYNGGSIRHPSKCPPPKPPAGMLI